MRTTDTKAFTPKARKDKKSQQAGTPREFLLAVQRHFQVTLGFDIACTQQDCVAFITREVRVNADCQPDPNGEHTVTGVQKFGYFHDLGVDALQQDWSTIEQDVAWLNNEYNHIAPWVEKCAQTMRGMTLTDRGPRIFQLIPAGVGTKWFSDFVAGQCDRYYLYPRIAFVNPETGKPFQHWNEKKQRMENLGINRDCMLLDWDSRLVGGEIRPARTYCWNWKTDSLIAA